MGQDWVVLFSHPDDFVSHDLELDRWVTLARAAFERNGVRPLALAADGQRADAGWVTQVSGDSTTLVLLQPRWSRFPDPFQFNGRELREDIVGIRGRSMACRFVAIVDPQMRRRWMYAYDDPSSVPSPLQIAYLAGELRAAERVPQPRRAYPAIRRSA
jgi:alkyl hydroperoxide reductase subunit AhpC